MKKMIVLTAIAVASALLASEVAARQLGPHVHGHGSLSIAVEGGKVAIELVAPGDDIVGFEHPAETPEQKTALEAAKGILSDPVTLLGIPGAAGCKALTAEVETRPEHEEPAADGAQPAAPEEPGQHSEFHARYDLICTTPAGFTGLTFTYFDKFANAKVLDIEVIAGAGQNQFEASRENPKVDFGGIVQ